MEFCLKHHGHENEAQFLRLDDSTVERIKFLCKLGCPPAKIYRKLRKKKEKNSAKTFISMDQINYYLKKDDEKRLSSNDLINIHLLNEKEEQLEFNKKWFRGYKHRNCDDA